MLKKIIPASVKIVDEVADTEETGVFEALVSTYDLDRTGDKIVPGAFEKDLAAWDESGYPIPVVWSHRHDDPYAHIGTVEEAAEREGEGLWVRGKLDIDDGAENPTARQVYRLMKAGRVKSFSFAYEVADAEPGEGEDDGATLLKELNIFEVGPCLVPANPHTELLAVKNDGDDDSDGEDDEATKETVSDRPWSDFPDSAFDDEQYARACILDRGPDAGTAKQRYALPVREPSGTLNRNAAHAAAAALSGARGGVDATPEQKATAARKLVAIYRQSLDEDPPEGVAELAKSVDGAVELNALLDTHPALVDVLRSMVATKDAKRGRVLSAKNETDLREASRLITGVLSQLGSEEPGDRDDGKNEEPNRNGAAKFEDDDLADLIQLAKLKEA